MNISTTSCLCGGSLAFSACCQPFLNGELNAPSPQHLMRSRYSAFVMHNADYLIATEHRSRHTADQRQQLMQLFSQTQWLGLRVLAVGDFSVEFVAYYKGRDPIEQLHEKSRFVKEGDAWLYLDGELLPPLTIGRNDLCICGSGKKIKKCHGS